MVLWITKDAAKWARGIAVVAACGAETPRKGGEKVTIRGFGTFVTSARAGRIGRNPRTGERIPARLWFRRGYRDGCENHD